MKKRVQTLVSLSDHQKGTEISQLVKTRRPPDHHQKTCTIDPLAKKQGYYKGQATWRHLHLPANRLPGGKDLNLGKESWWIHMSGRNPLVLPKNQGLREPTLLFFPVFHKAKMSALALLSRGLQTIYETLLASLPLCWAQASHVISRHCFLLSSNLQVSDIYHRWA